MRPAHLIQLASLLAVTWTCTVAAQRQQNPPSTSRRANGDTAQAAQTAREPSLEETLGWLDQYLTKQILFRKEDVAAIRDKVAQMTPDQLKLWLDKTKEIRQILESPEWRRTNIWLMSYLPQYFATDQQMDEFRAKSAEMTPEEIHDMLDRLKEKHETIMSAHSAMYATQREQKSRQQRTAVETQQRMATNQAWAKYSKNEAQRVEASRRQERSSQPFYGQNQTHASNQRQRISRRYNQPLISSKDAARGVVQRSVYGGYGYRW